MAERRDLDFRMFLLWLPVLAGLSFTAAGIVDWIHDPHGLVGKVGTFLGVALYLLGGVFVVRERRRRKRGTPTPTPHPDR